MPPPIKNLVILAIIGAELAGGGADSAPPHSRARNSEPHSRARFKRHRRKIGPREAETDSRCLAVHQSATTYLDSYNGYGLITIGRHVFCSMPE